MSSNKSKDQTATKHAKAIIMDRYDAWDFSRKTAKRAMTDSGPMIRAVQEDILHGTLDGIGIRVGEPMLLAQWTWNNPSPVRARRMKIEQQLCNRLYDGVRAMVRDGRSHDVQEAKRWFDDRFSLQLWAWEPRKGFVVTLWDWERWSWQRPLREFLTPPGFGRTAGGKARAA